jgi:hypothetical protein
MQRYATQKWPYKEAVVVNSTDLELETQAPNVRIINIKARFLGELKNLALYNAKGEWCFPWLDDCDYRPDYMDFHMQRRGKAFPTVIRNPMAFVLKDRISHPVDWDMAPCASFFRFSPYIYDQDGSEVHFLDKYPEKNFVNADGLVTRFFEDYAE